MCNQIKKKIGQNLRELRIAKGLKQHELAELVGVEDKTISRIEVGGNYPSLALLVKLAEALECKLTNFVDLGENDTVSSAINELNETEVSAVKKFLKILIKKI